MTLPEFRRKIDAHLEGIRIHAEGVRLLLPLYEKEIVRLQHEVAIARAALEINSQDQKLNGGQFN